MDQELLVTETARSISKQVLFLKLSFYSLGVTLNLHEYMLVGQTVCKSGEKIKGIRHGEVFLKDNFNKRIQI